jgi:WD40 repeat protein
MARLFRSRCMATIRWRQAAAIITVAFFTLLALVRITAQTPVAQAQEGEPRPKPLILSVQDRQAALIDAHGDPLPAGALRRFGTIQFRQPGGFCYSALSADGTLLALTGGNTVVLTDVATGRRLRTFAQCGIWEGPKPSAAQTHVALSPDGKLMAHATGTGVLVRVWNIFTGKEVCKVQGRHLPGEYPELVHTLRFSADGRQLVVCAIKEPVSYDLLLCDSHTGQIHRSRQLPTKILAFTADATRYVLQIDKGAARPNGPPLQTAFVLAETVSGKEFSRVVVDNPPPELCPGYVTALSADGKLLAVALARTGAPEIWVWDMTTGKEKCRLYHPEPPRPILDFDKGDPRVFMKLAFAVDGQTLFAGTLGGAIYRFDLTRSKKLAPLVGHRERVRRLHPTPDGRRLVSTSWDGCVRRWDLATGKELPLPDGYLGQVQAAQSPDRKLLALGDLQGKLDLWDTATGIKVRSLRQSGPWATWSVFSPDGKTLATVDTDGLVRLWEVTSGREVRQWRVVEKQRIYSNTEWLYTPINPCWLLFTRDGSRLLTSDAKHGLRVWQLATGKELRQLRAGSLELWHFFRTVALSADGKVLVTALGKSQLSFHDPATGQQRPSITILDGPGVLEQGSSLPIECVALTADGQRLATGYLGLVRFWDSSGKMVGEIVRGRLMVGRIDQPYFNPRSLQFSADGQWLLTAEDDTVRIWEVATRQEVMQLFPAGYLHFAAFAAGDWAVLTCAGCETLLWSLKPENLPKTQGNLEAIWADLGSKDAAAAYRVVWALSEDPAAAVELLRRKVAPVTQRIESKKMHQLIAELDADRFARRTRAAKVLADLGLPVLPYLHAALGQANSLEQKSRLKELCEQILEREKLPAKPEAARLLRAVQILERAATADCRALLRSWAGGTPGFPLTEQARAALRRLKAN